MTEEQFREQSRQLLDAARMVKAMTNEIAAIKRLPFARDEMIMLLVRRTGGQVPEAEARKVFAALAVMQKDLKRPGARSRLFNAMVSAVSGIDVIRVREILDLARKHAAREALDLAGEDETPTNQQPETA